MSQLSVIAKIPAAPGKRDELAEILKNEALSNVGAEEGTLHYTLHADSKDENVLWMFEIYTGQDALNAHMGADWFKALGPKMAALLGGRPELIFMTPLAGKGLPG